MTDEREGEALYQALLAGDRTAPDRLCALYLDPLVTYLRRRFRADPEDIYDAAVDALIALIRRPETYNPAKSPLFAYLKMSAAGDLRNRLAKKQRETLHFRSLATVDPVVLQRNTEVNGHDNLDIFASTLFGVRQLLSHLNETDRAIADLILREDHGTEAYARVLGVAHLPPDLQRREVKRAKDRVKKRLRRLWEKLRAQTPA